MTAYAIIQRKLTIPKEMEIGVGDVVRKHAEGLLEALLETDFNGRLDYSESSVLVLDDIIDELWGGGGACG